MTKCHQQLIIYHNNLNKSRNFYNFIKQYMHYLIYMLNNEIKEEIENQYKIYQEKSKRS